MEENVNPQKVENLNLSFEKAFQELESIVKKLESAEVSIDESIELYERGMRLRTYCQDKLNQAKLKIEKIVQDDSGQIASKPAPELSK